MAQEEEAEGPSIHEKIAWLEASMSRRDKIMLGLVVLTALLFSVTVTGFVTLHKKVNSAVKDVKKEIAAEVIRFKGGMGDVKQLTLDYETKVAKLDLMLNNLELNKEIRNLNHIKKVLIEQEKSFQSFLATLKTGTFSLARMLRGSRAWYEDYEEKINQAIHASSLRSKRIEALLPLKLLINKNKQKSDSSSNNGKNKEDKKTSGKKDKP